MVDNDVVIREGRVEDAAAIIPFMQTLSMEPGIGIGFTAGEFKGTVEEEEAWIRARLEDDNSLIMVAIAPGEGGAEGELVALMDCTGGKRVGNRHETTLGISIKKEWRDKGIGTRLMEAALEWARGSGIVKRVQLEVFSNNERAIHLYEKVGFVREGVRRRAFRKEGKWLNSVVMAVVLEDARTED